MNNDKENEELLSIFVEEASDLLNAISDTLQKWSSDLNNTAYFAPLKRDLHTLKGGARMVGQGELSALAHELESLTEALIQGLVVNDKSIYDWICKGQDRIAVMVEALRHKEKVTSATDLINQYEKLIKKEKIEEKTIKSEVKIEEKPKEVLSDIIRIHVSLLEKLNNLSIENNTLSVNLEHQVSTLKNNLVENNKLIKKIQENMRSNEFNNASSLTELFNSLFLINKAIRENWQSAETLVAAQNKIAREFDTELMETRLEPFQTIVPRLGRIVRQLSQELSKKIDFSVSRAEGVIDRNLLEHLTPALEHVLRNSIDHGIESPLVRSQENKPEVGKINLTFIHRSNEVIIDISDDGAGIDPVIVRSKAIKLGLLSEDAKIDEKEITRFIFEPGFSTSEVVTEISGRGIGMDVVNTVVKGLGGHILLNSTPKVGTTLSIRLPFTTSKNRALLFKIKDETYGILLSNIKNIILMSEKQINDSLNSKFKILKIENEEYHLNYLASILHENKPYSSKKKNAAVLLLEAFDYNLALIVDELKGSQEVFVQSLGPQFKLSDLFSGGTLLPNGEAVILLDTYALVKKSLEQTQNENPFDNIQKEAIVMVVDDSITIRTITKNFLEKHKFKVITAKDGRDALELLENEKPDIILLDVEMPRMNGFEFTDKIRKDERFKKIPIIMITFRSAKEYKERALQLGVEHFMVKPYQENELLDYIELFLGRR